MTNEPDEPTPVSMTKQPAGAAATPRPHVVTGAVVALIVSGVAALLASAVLYGQTDWLHKEQLKTNRSAVSSVVASAVSSASKASKDVPSASASASASATKRYPLGGSALHHQLTQQQSGALIGSLVLVLAMSFLVVGVFRGRHWSRWAVVAFWFLASFTGTFAGVTNMFAVGSSFPVALRVPLFVSSAALLVAVVLVNLRQSTSYFALSRPAGAPARPRRGLFAPRFPAEPPARRGARPSSAPNGEPRSEAAAQKQRAKKRAAANAESVARGAELARTRAKASKSRRTES